MEAPVETLSQQNYDGTRGQNMKLFKKRNGVGDTNNIFSAGVVDRWDVLDEAIVLATSASVFKINIGLSDIGYYCRVVILRPQYLVPKGFVTAKCQETCLGFV